MSSALINLSPDLVRLLNDGYEVSIQAGYLVVDNVPYVDSERNVRRGRLVSALNMAGTELRPPNTHVALFAGKQPCYQDGKIIGGLVHATQRQDLGDGLVVDLSFSNKPPEGYPDYYSKMTRYITMISDPARGIDPGATARTHKPVESHEDDSPFVYQDTNASRAYIGAITAKLKGHRLAIVGLGGTGGYILDSVAKTPVKEIHLFDGDHFFSHNAFRAPGATALDILKGSPLKVEYFKGVYSNMHKGIVAHPTFIGAANADALAGFDFAFLSMDASEDKRHIMDFLITQKIPFVDCGLGIQQEDGRLMGIVRTTTVAPTKQDHIAKRISCIETKEDDYASNIQIAELNMLSAVMAVIKWKKITGFYVDFEHEHHSTYTISGNMLLSEEIAPA
jgi:tRNA A37 threonylcarbamoyladenosine dehydratase